MYIVANRIPVASGWQNEFELRFSKRVGQINKQTGFVSMQVLKPETSEAPYVVLTTWENEEAFDIWLQSDDFKRSHQNPFPKEAFTGKPAIEKYSVVISAEVG